MAAQKRSGTRWTKTQSAALRKLAKGNTPTRVIGLKLGRSASAVYSKAARLGVSLKPTNQRPYSRRKR